MMMNINGSPVLFGRVAKSDEIKVIKGLNKTHFKADGESEKQQRYFVGEPKKSGLGTSLGVLLDNVRLFPLEVKHFFGKLKEPVTVLRLQKYNSKDEADKFAHAELKQGKGVERKKARVSESEVLLKITMGPQK